MALALYEPGEHPVRWADIMPAQVTPRPDGVPSGSKLRVIVTERYLTILWQSGAGPTGPIIGRLDIEVDPEQTNGDYRSGQAGEYAYSKAGGCGCGANALKGFQAFPGITFTEPAREARTESRARTYGLPSQRYSRTRSS